MKKSLLSLVGIIALSTVGLAQKFEWNTGATSGSHIWFASTISQSGNTVISGSYGSFMQIDTVSRTGTKYYMSMVDSTGAIKYFRTSNRGISMLACDKNNNTFIGINETSIAFDNDTIKSDTVNEHIVLAKFDTQMSMLWKKQIKPVNPSANILVTCIAMSTDLSGNIFALYSSTSQENARMDTAHFNCYGNILVKFNANGTMQFLRKIGLVPSPSISVMNTDNSGNVWIAGKLGYNSYASSQMIDFGNNVIITNTTASSNGNSIPFVACFNPSGIAQSASFIGNWTSQFTATVTPKGITFDSNNNAVMYNTTDFYKFSANGTYQWTKSASDIYKIKFGSDDRMYFMTSYSASSGATIGDTTFARAAFTTTSSDRALFCFDTAFKCVWVRYFQKAETNNVLPSLEVIENGDIYFTSCEFSLNAIKYGKLGTVDYGTYGIFATFIEDPLSIGHMGGSPFILKLSPIELPTSITETSSSFNRMNVYPNPSSGKFSIEFFDLNKQLDIEIYNVLGEKVYSSTKANTSKTIIDISNQPKGIYFVKIQEGTNTYTKKIVVE